jgi:hypothetical protein
LNFSIEKRPLQRVRLIAGGSSRPLRRHSVRRDEENEGTRLLADGLVFLKHSGAKRTRGEPPAPLKSVPVAAGLPADTIVSAQSRRRLPTGTKKAPCPRRFPSPFIDNPPPSLFPLPSAPSSLAPHRGWGRGMTGLRAREPGDISPGVGQFPKTHPMLLVSRFLSPHYAAAEPPQPSQDGHRQATDQRAT